MQPLKFEHNGIVHDSLFEYFQTGVSHRFRVFINDRYLVIAIAGFRTPQNKIIWVQSNEPNEPDLDHDLVQALGEGIEKLYFLE
jgi:hypothetical protein